MISIKVSVEPKRDEYLEQAILEALIKGIDLPNYDCVMTIELANDRTLL